MNKGLLTALMLTLTVNSMAQLKKVEDIKKSLETTNKDTVAWIYGGLINFGVNEGFLHNWAAGGELISMTISGVFNGHLDYVHHRKVWSNNLDINYGLVYAYSNDFQPHKTDDRIDFTSKYGIRYDTSNFYFTGLFNFKSQFSNGFNYNDSAWRSKPTSTFFSPAYFTTAIGMEYRRGSDLSLFLSPIAGRLTVASQYYTRQSDQGAFGVPYNKTSYYQLGAYFSGRYDVNIRKNLSFKTRLDLYSDYLAKETKDSTGHVIKKDSPANISVLFDNFLAWKISKYLNISVGATFIYDNNIPYVPPVNQYGPGSQVPGNNLGWMQIKQVFTLGFLYKF